MAASRNRLIRVRQVSVLASSGFLFQVFRSGQIEFKHVKPSYRSTETIFARHGIPETVRSDNGSQYLSREFATFASSYGFSHVTSSPRYPQSNRQVERMVQTIKRMFKKSPDPHIAVLSYRTTPHPWCGYSPAELCIGRRILTAVPQSNAMLVPQWSYLKEFRVKNADFKRKQKEQFDSHY